MLRLGRLRGVPRTGGAGHLQSLKEVLSDSTARAKFNTVLITVFAGLALVMACSGIYGVISYSVELRRRELGIRMAVGARPAEIRRLILRNAATLVLPGACVGFICAQGVAKYMSAVIFGTSTITISVIAAVFAIFLSIAAIAAYTPVRRAMRIDPCIILRD